MMRTKLQVNVNGKWTYVGYVNNGNIVTTEKAYEAMTGNEETLNKFSNDYYGKDFRIVR